MKTLWRANVWVRKEISMFFTYADIREWNAAPLALNGRRLAARSPMQNPKAVCRPTVSHSVVLRSDNDYEMFVSSIKE